MNRRQDMMRSAAAPPPAQDYAPEPPPAPTAEPQMDSFEALKKLGELHAQGILTDEEFAAQKAKILDG